MNHHSKFLIVAAGALACALPVLAQPQGEQAPAVRPPKGTTISVPVGPAPLTKTKASFSDPELEAIANMLSGCRKAEIAGYGGIVLAITPVGINGATDALYAE